MYVCACECVCVCVWVSVFLGLSHRDYKRLVSESQAWSVFVCESIRTHQHQHREFTSGGHTPTHTYTLYIVKPPQGYVLTPPMSPQAETSVSSFALHVKWAVHSPWSMASIHWSRGLYWELSRTAYLKHTHFLPQMNCMCNIHFLLTTFFSPKPGLVQSFRFSHCLCLVLQEHTEHYSLHQTKASCHKFICENGGIIMHLSHRFNIRSYIFNYRNTLK